MPFPNARRTVSRRLQHFGNRHVFKRQFLPKIRFQQLGRGPLLAAGNEIGQMQPRRIFARENAGTRRRTNRTRRIGIGESHALRSQPVNVRRAVVTAAIAA